MTKTNLLKEIKNQDVFSVTKKREYWWIGLWMAYTAFLLWGLIGRGVGAIDGENLWYYGLFFTYQSSWIMWGAFTTMLAFKYTKLKFLSFSQTQFFRGAATSYITLTFLVATFIIGPLMLSGQWGDAGDIVQQINIDEGNWFALYPSSNPDSQAANTAWAFETAGVHVIFPIIFITDYFMWSGVVNKENDMHMVKKVAIWSIYPIVYIIVSMINGAFTGWYPYQIFDMRGFGWSAPMYIILIAVTYLTVATMYAEPWLTKSYARKLKIKKA